MKYENSKPKKPTGLGRGFDSLLEDNSPVVSGKPQVIKREDAEEARKNRENSDNLYKKEGAISYVKTPKRSRS